MDDRTHEQTDAGQAFCPKCETRAVRAYAYPGDAALGREPLTVRQCAACGWPYATGDNEPSPGWVEIPRPATALRAELRAIRGTLRETANDRETQLVLQGARQALRWALGRPDASPVEALGWLLYRAVPQTGGQS